MQYTLFISFYNSSQKTQGSLALEMNG